MKLKDEATAEAYKRPESYSGHGTDQLRQRKELWLYLGVGIFALVCLVTVTAVSYGFITATTAPGGETRLNFPLLSWLAGVIVLPTALVVAVHYAGVGLFEQTSRTAEEEAEWQARLPERFQRVYRFLKGAPVAVVLLALIIAGATLATIDGALSAFVRVASVFAPYIPHIVISLAAIVCCALLVAAWFKYRSRRLEAEFAFRREIFERTGMVIVDKNSIALPPATATAQHALPPVIDAEAHATHRALPPCVEDTQTPVTEAKLTVASVQGESSNTQDVTPENTQERNSAPANNNPADSSAPIAQNTSYNTAAAQQNTTLEEDRATVIDVTDPPADSPKL